MKKLIFVSFMALMAQMSFASIYGVSTESITESVRVVASKVMLQDKMIKEPLELNHIWKLTVSTDLLESDQSMSITAEIGPEESNCECQDIFKAYISAKVIDGELVIKNGASVERLYFDD